MAFVIYQSEFAFSTGKKVMTKLEKEIYEIVRKIPKGKVMTYGQVAAKAGNPKLSRVVGNVMHKNPNPFWDLAIEAGFKGIKKECTEPDFLPVPCHRVVNAKGEMGKNFGLGGPSVQEKMLILEGARIEDGKILLQF